MQKERARTSGPFLFAGLALYQNEQCNYVLGVTSVADGKPCVSLAKSDEDGKKAVASAALPKDGAVMLKAEAKNEVVRFFWSLDGKRWSAIGGDEDARILTTDYAGMCDPAALGWVHHPIG